MSLVNILAAIFKMAANLCVPPKLCKQIELFFWVRTNPENIVSNEIFIVDRLV